VFLKLRYILMSVFVTWQTFAMLILPAYKENATLNWLYEDVVHPYVTLFGFNLGWSFYSPSVTLSGHLRYVIEDAARKRYSFEPANELNRWLPDDWWFRFWYNAIYDTPDTYGDLAANYFCRKHAALRPVSISFVKVEERAQDFTPADRLSGKSPLDDEFVTETIVKQAECPS